MKRFERRGGGPLGGPDEVVVDRQPVAEPRHVASLHPIRPCRHRHNGRTVSE
jgi:hypothetical protein